MTYMAYIDETGDTGDHTLRGSSSCYALGCVLVDLDRWAQAFDRMLEFRRHLRQQFGIPVRQELKANYLIRNSGGLRPLNLAPSQRAWIYRAHLRLLAELNAEVFGVVTDKAATGWSDSACFDGTWEMLLQRLDRMTQYENRTVILSHDSGENDSVRSLVRRARRHLTAGRMAGGGQLSFKADRILEDPIPRDSQHSFFIQMADIVAYTGWRSYMAPSRSVAQVVPQGSWAEIGRATKVAVNQRRLNNSVPGVVLRTR